MSPPTRVSEALPAGTEHASTSTSLPTDPVSTQLGLKISSSSHAVSQQQQQQQQPASARMHRSASSTDAGSHGRPAQDRQPEPSAIAAEPRAPSTYAPSADRQGPPSGSQVHAYDGAFKDWRSSSGSQGALPAGFAEIKSMQGLAAEAVLEGTLGSGSVSGWMHHLGDSAGSAHVRAEHMAMPANMQYYTLDGGGPYVLTPYPQGYAQGYAQCYAQHTLHGAGHALQQHHGHATFQAASFAHQPGAQGYALQHQAMEGPFRSPPMVLLPSPAPGAAGSNAPFQGTTLTHAPYTPGASSNAPLPSELASSGDKDAASMAQHAESAANTVDGVTDADDVPCWLGNECRDFLSGRCHYTHTQIPEECAAFQAGNCPHGPECPRLHFHNSPPCKFFAHGLCRNGDACRFRHERTVPSVQQAAPPPPPMPPVVPHQPVPLAAAVNAAIAVLRSDAGPMVAVPVILPGSLPPMLPGPPRPQHDPMLTAQRTQALYPVPHGYGKPPQPPHPHTHNEDLHRVALSRANLTRTQLTKSAPLSGGSLPLRRTGAASSTSEASTSSPGAALALASAATSSAPATGLSEADMHCGVAGRHRSLIRQARTSDSHDDDDDDVDDGNDDEALSEARDAVSAETAKALTDIAVGKIDARQPPHAKRKDRAQRGKVDPAAAAAADSSRRSRSHSARKEPARSARSSDVLYPNVLHAGSPLAYIDASGQPVTPLAGPAAYMQPFVISEAALPAFPQAGAPLVLTEQRPPLFDLTLHPTHHFEAQRRFLGREDQRNKECWRGNKCYNHLHGRSCKFSHTQEAVQCPDFEQGKCALGAKCPRMHVGGDELEACKYFVRGFCAAGANCRYRHDPEASPMKESPGTRGSPMHRKPLKFSAQTQTHSEPGEAPAGAVASGAGSAASHVNAGLERTIERAIERTQQQPSRPVASGPPRPRSTALRAPTAVPLHQGVGHQTSPRGVPQGGDTL